MVEPFFFQSGTLWSAVLIWEALSFAMRNQCHTLSGKQKEDWKAKDRATRKAAAACRRPSTQLRRLARVVLAPGRTQYRRVRHQTPEPGDHEQRDAQQGPPDLLPYAAQRLHGVGLGIVDGGPMRQIPGDELQAEQHGQSEARYGEDHLGVTLGAARHERTETRQRQICSHAAPRRLPAQSFTLSERQRDFHTRAPR